MHFCYVTPGSRTPRRYRCQPDLAEEEARGEIPKEAVRPTASVHFAVGDDSHGPSNDCLAQRGKANLELLFEVGNPAPTVGDMITLTLTLDNHGPRNAADVVVTIAPPTPGCLDLESLTISQGSFEEDDAIWNVGDLKAGGCAALTARLRVTAACNEQETLEASLTAYTFTGDGQAFLAAIIRRVRERVQPRFNSTRYGTPTYAQLALYCTDEITRGADDESEMGAFHDLFQPQRATNLEARLNEFVPAGMDAAIVYV
jgi:uncharacterized repeat protein (TIGR01451 family)